MLLQHDDSTINIVLVLLFIINYYINQIAIVRQRRVPNLGVSSSSSFGDIDAAMVNMTLKDL